MQKKTCVILSVALGATLALLAFRATATEHSASRAVMTSTSSARNMGSASMMMIPKSTLYTRSCLHKPKASITAQDSTIFDRYATHAENLDWQTLDINDIVTLTGQYFCGTKYQPTTLEVNSTEKLVVNLSGMDCTTFTENVIALSRCTKSGKLSLNDFERELQTIRYRHGEINGFSSRLHYLSDWIFDNQYKGIITDVTRQLGGIPTDKTINYMTTHPDRYRQLDGDINEQTRMKFVEDDINLRTRYYIPRNNINDDLADQIHDGDIICFTTDAKGLDYAHLGFAKKDDNGTLHFMHCSLSIGHALVTSRTLKEYMSNKKHFTGITVLRLN